MEASICFGKRNLFVSCLILTVFLILISCSNEEGPTDPGGDDIPMNTLVDTTINSASGDITVSVSEKIHITIPQGIAPAGTNLTISEIADADAPPDENLDISSVFEVELSSGTQFDKPLTIKIYFDPATLSAGNLKYNIGAAYYDENMAAWKIYADAVVDSVENSITFETSHLTKLSKWSLSNYTDYLTTSHFNVYWKDGDVPSNSEYSSPFASEYTSTDPHYIQDIGRFLEDAYRKYQAEQLTVPYFRTSVYVTTLQDDGETSFFGYITINKNITADNGTTQTHALKKACAHEFLHIVQDYYYHQYFAAYAHKWWFEATATQADRIVYPNNPPFESVQYTDESFAEILSKSWDDCNSDPAWYQAGGFLAYLSAYREGAKLSVVDLIKKGGDVQNGWFIRDIVNNEIGAKLNSSIGQEYHNYIKWAYERQGEIRMKMTRPLSSANAPYVYPARFTQSKKSFNYVLEALPYLSAKVIKIMNYDASEEKLKFKFRRDNNISAYMYYMIDDKMNFMRELGKEDSLEANFPKSANWIDILMINKNNVTGETFSAEVNLVAAPKITSISPSQGKAGDQVTINGRAFGTDQSAGKVFFGTIQATGIASWSDTQIRVSAPAGVTSCYVTVKVGEETSNGMSFKVGEPVITKVDTYDNILIAGRATIDIRGEDFGYTEGKILFGDEETLPLYSGTPTVQWGDLYIKTIIPIDATVDSVQVQTESGDKSNSYPLEYLSIAEYLQQCEGHMVQASADYTLQWETDAGVQTERFEYGSIGFSTGGMTISGNGHGFTATYDSGSEVYSITSAVQFIGPKPSQYKMNGQYTTTRTRKLENPDGSHDATTISVQFEGLPLYLHEHFTFQDRDSNPSVYIKSVNITVLEWDYSTGKLLEKTLADISYIDFYVAGFYLP